MATKYVCDRCGSESKDLHQQLSVYCHRGSRDLLRDLCEDCVKSLRNWLLNR